MKPHRFAEYFDFSALHCASHIQMDKAMRSLGTLGGGNHFIEANKDDDGNLYIVIHSDQHAGWYSSWHRKRNPDWNCSAPHGSGRIMKREDVKSSFTVSSFKSVMKGIYSSCINKDTLDEAPFAYRSMDDMLDVIQDTVDITNVLRPVYNFKAGGK